MRYAAAFYSDYTGQVPEELSRVRLSPSSVADDARLAECRGVQCRKTMADVVVGG